MQILNYSSRFLFFKIHHFHHLIDQAPHQYFSLYIYIHLRASFHPSLLQYLKLIFTLQFNFKEEIRHKNLMGFSSTFPSLVPMAMFFIAFLALCLMPQPSQAITRHYEFNVWYQKFILLILQQIMCILNFLLLLLTFFSLIFWIFNVDYNAKCH